MPPLSKHDIAEYYSDPAVRAEILSQIKNKPVLAVNSREGKTFVRRNAPSGKPIRILKAMNNASDQNDLAWYTDRRYSEFHPTIGRRTRKVWVDIDPGPKRDFESLKPVVSQVENALREMPEVRDTDITYSGGRGFHVRGNLRRKSITDDIRHAINKQLQEKGILGTVFQPPQGREIRLDTSTLKNKGSIRAAYSLNSETGRVAVPLTQRELRGFKPEQASVKRILREKEFAPGVPRSKRIYALPETANDKQWTMSVQEHLARRAGRHWDLRLVDPETGFAHSWAVPKAQFPEEKQRVLAVRTPTHTEQYALNFGDHEPQTIGRGYGKGTVEIVHKEPVKIVKSNNNRVQFDRILGDEKERLTLFRTKGDTWLLQRTPSLEKEGTAMVSAREMGYLGCLEKLGLRQQTSDPSPCETPSPQDTFDENTPAGGLAATLSKMDLPDYAKRVRKSDSHGDSAERRLNRDVQWGSPQDIPREFMEGATVPMPGGGF